MALIKCFECGKDISDDAKFCPQCGAKNKNKVTMFNIFLLLIIVPLPFLFIFDASKDFKIIKSAGTFFTQGTQTEQDINAIRQVLAPTIEQQKINEEKSAEQQRLYLQQQAQKELQNAKAMSDYNNCTKTLMKRLDDYVIKQCYNLIHSDNIFKSVECQDNAKKSEGYRQIKCDYPSLSF